MKDYSEDLIDTFRESLISILLSESQEFILPQVEAVYIASVLYDDGHLLRFIEKYQYDLEKAKTHFLKHLSFHISNQFHSISLSSSSLPIHLKSHYDELSYLSILGTRTEEQQQQQQNHHRHHRNHYNGQQSISSSFQQFLCKIKLKKVFHQFETLEPQEFLYRIQLNLECLRRILALRGEDSIHFLSSSLSTTNGASHPPSLPPLLKTIQMVQMSFLIDLSECPISYQIVSLFKLCQPLLQDHYPKFVDKVYITNYSWMYASVWSVLSSFLSASAKERIVFEDSIPEFMNNHQYHDQHLFFSVTDSALTSPSSSPTRSSFTNTNNNNSFCHLNTNEQDVDKKIYLGTPLSEYMKTCFNPSTFISTETLSLASRITNNKEVDVWFDALENAFSVRHSVVSTHTSPKLGPHLSTPMSISPELKKTDSEAFFLQLAQKQELESIHHHHYSSSSFQPRHPSNDNKPKKSWYSFIIDYFKSSSSSSVDPTRSPRHSDHDTSGPFFFFSWKKSGIVLMIVLAWYSWKFKKHLFIKSTS